MDGFAMFGAWVGAISEVSGHILEHSLAPT